MRTKSMYVDSDTFDIADAPTKAGGGAPLNINGKNEWIKHVRNQIKIITTLFRPSITLLPHLTLAPPVQLVILTRKATINTLRDAA